MAWKSAKKAKAATTRTDIYQTITDDIITLLEAGTRPWSPSWSRVGAVPLRHCGTAYQGINILVLWAQAARRGYANPYWMTYNQAQELGAQVREGEKGTAIVYAGAVTPKDENGQPVEREGEGERRIPFLKRYYVFNAEQIADLPEGRFLVPERPVPNRDARDPVLDEAFAAYGVAIREQAGDAYYCSESDCIIMPRFESFTSGNAYYATLAHEAIHSTGHQARLNRETLRKYNDQVAIRAKEELIAEIGAAYLCAALGMEPTEREDHAAYVAYWLSTLKNDKRAIFQAAAAAQSASDFFLTQTALRAAA